jgi:DNA primase small subunit
MAVRSAVRALTAYVPNSDPDPDPDPDAMGAYWQRWFPAEEVHALFAVAHGASSETEAQPLTHREWGVEMRGGGFRRWRECADAVALSAYVRDAGVEKLNVGAVYAQPVGERYDQRRPFQTQPHAREFAIDIDLDDYGGVQKTDLGGCDRNWPVVALGIAFVRKILQSACGFKHFLLVYSGRRGAHLWVLDRRACAMSRALRASLVAFLQSAAPYKDGGRRAFGWVRRNANLAPLVLHAVRFFEARGVRAAGERGGVGMLDEPQQRETFVAMALPSQGVEFRTMVRTKTGPQALELIRQKVQRSGLAADLRNYEDAVLTLLWPRLDAAVSTDMGHMLKAPFSVHPKTGRVAVPVALTTDPTRWSPVENAPHVAKLRGGDAKSIAQFRAAVQVLREVVEPASRAETHNWEATPLPMPFLKRPLTISLLGATCAPPRVDGERVLLVAPHTRLCWKLVRTFTAVRHAAHPEDVHIEETTTKARFDVVRTIEAEQFPPFESDDRTVEARLQNILSAARACWSAELPAGSVGGGKTKRKRREGEGEDEGGDCDGDEKEKVEVHDTRTYVAFHGDVRHFVQLVKDKTVEEATDHFESLSKDLSTPRVVAKVRFEWGEDGVMSVLRMRLAHRLKCELHSL